MLRNAVVSGHLCHAYLFFGPEGVGKQAMAEDFAQMLLCRSGQPPCGQCSGCRKALSANHPDLWIYEGKGGANSIHIDVIRGMRQDVYIKPNESERKIYILPCAEDMSIGAANAFLKVLEEPPAYAVFLLTANNRDRLPETIRSRCIMLEMFPLREADIALELKQEYPDRDPAELEAAAAFSGGLFGQAVAYLTDEGYHDIAALADQVLAGILSGREYDILAALSGASSKERMKLLLNRLIRLLREVLYCKLRGAGPGGLVEKLARKATVSQLERAVSLLEEANQGVDGNANPGLLANVFAARLKGAFGD